MKAPDNSTLRALLAAAPGGTWRVERMGDDSWALIRDAACGCENPGCDRGFERVDAYEGAARLTVLAPTLAAEVIALRANLAAVRAEAGMMIEGLFNLQVARDAAVAERDALLTAVRARVPT